MLGMLSNLLGGQISNKMLKLFWDQFSEQMRISGGKMIEDPDRLIKFLRDTADALERRKGNTDVRQGEE